MSNPPDSLEDALEKCLAHAAAGGILLGEMMEHLGRSSFCFVALLLAMPFVQPFSLGPLNMIGGFTFMIVGWQMGTGRSKPVLPKSAAKLNIHGKGWVAALRFCKRLLVFCRKFTRARLSGWVSGDKGEKIVGWLIFAGGALLAVPVANLPFNNTLPALMIVFACIGWLEKDGLMVIVSLAWGAATLLYFLAVALAVVFFGAQIWHWLSGFSVFR
ncbi:MAG: exopolysaccharide biosynthesis protein [Chthoniobacterales bacterium]|nr:exopolysaccharide biosynthesis protein [Chthoniobacterales bacterium]